MSTITVKDGTTIYCKDWGEAPVITFSESFYLHCGDWRTDEIAHAVEGL